MQTGPSRELLELWAPDSRNGLIITGYSIEGTLARVSDYLPMMGIFTYSVLSVYNISQWALFSYSTSLHESPLWSRYLRFMKLIPYDAFRT